MFRVHRIFTDLQGENEQRETIYGVTSLPADEATPEQLLELNRGHWGIENKVHWVRDVTFDEDRSQVRTNRGPRVMASLRNIAISLIRMNKHTNIAKALRYFSREADRPIDLLLR